MKEYDYYFTVLTQFSPHITFNKHQRAHHFKKELRPSIKKFVIILILSTYVEVLNQALMMKK